MFRFIKGFMSRWKLWQEQKQRQQFLQRLRAQAIYDKRHAPCQSE